MEGVSFLSSDACESGSIDGSGDSDKGMIVHSLIDVSVDILVLFSLEALEHWLRLTRKKPKEKLQRK